MVFRQIHRTLKIATPLGEDAVQLVALSGEERLSRLFEFQLGLVSEDNSIEACDIVGHNVSFAVDLDDGEPRYFNGFVQRFVAGDEDRKGRREYSMTVVPWLWFLTQAVDCRIFQDMTAVEIIEEVFRLRGFSDFEFNVQNPEIRRQYCVQYCESDFDFISRLMEEDGIFFYFRHENGRHVMVIGDRQAAWVECEQATVDFKSHRHERLHFEPHITAWKRAWKFRSGCVALTDYNFHTPNHDLLTSERTVVNFKNAPSLERFDYPAGHSDRALGRSLARVRMEEIESDQDIVSGSSTCKSFSPGGKFTIGSHCTRSEEGKQYVLCSVQHHAHSGPYESGEEHTRKFHYTNNFQCFPEPVKHRPERVTRRALIRGCQTARVTGPEGEEIHTDELGRVKVKFHWDRWGANDETSSCWIRVSHQHAGSGWGYIDLPRVGEEVIVDFLEGDPDQPIIVGRVYNGLNGTPFALPEEKTRRGYTTQTHDGEGYNELSMDDKKGSEQIRIHAQRNMDTVVRSCQTLVVGHDRSKQIGNDDTEAVGGNKALEVGKNRDALVKENDSLSVRANQVVEIEKNQAIVVGDDCQVDCGKNLRFNAGDTITLHTGKASITMNSDGTIEIRGTDVKIRGDEVSSEAVFNHVIKGTLVHIN